MVNRAVLLGLLWGLLAVLDLDAAMVEVEVHGERAAAFGPIEAFIRIQRAEDEAIDPQSFRLQNRALDVEFLHDSLHSTVSIVNGRRRETRYVGSTYRFKLPGVAAGEYVLPPVSVVVGGKRLQTETVPYFVHSGATSDGFRLRAFIRGPDTLYPGQTTELVYRLAFLEPVEPYYEKLPFLEPDDFRKIGEPVETYSAQEDVTIKEIVQVVQALSPGKFLFDQAVVEGQIFRRDFFGRRIFDKKRLRAEAPPLELVVAPFPTSGCPAGFDGALGRFSLVARLLGTDQVMVGDRLRLEVVVTGSGVFSTVRPPDLSSIRAIARDFRLSDLPPQIETTPEGKTFIYELRPLTEEITEIPALSVSSFDPQTHHYLTALTKSIPLSVTKAPHSLMSHPNAAVSVEQDHVSHEAERRLMEIQGALAIRALDLRSEDPPFTGLWLFPLIGLAWAFQWQLRRWVWNQRPRDRPLTSQELLKQARASWLADPARAMRDLEAALLLKLYEMDRVSDVPVVTELARDGVTGRVRLFLEDLHGAYYGKAGGIGEIHLQQAEVLWAELSS